MLRKLSRLINKSVNTKITLIVVTMTLLISGLIGIVSIVNHRQQIIDLKTEQAAKAAQMAAILINGDKFAEMADAETENEYYDEVKSILSNMKTASGVVYLYSVIPDSKNQVMRYIAEGQTATDDPEDIYTFNFEEDYNDTFESADQITGFDAAYAGGTNFDSGMYTDEKYGLLETVYAPIRGADGKVKGWSARTSLPKRLSPRLIS